jgi:DNA-binding MarR family transcriptional regulator/RimJ/RimL family protein N-acetyltransferase
MSDTLAAALRLRQFNRFYTQRLGLLNANHLQSPFSLAEVRVLYELAHREQPTASDIAAALVMDEGYLSRLLRRFRHQGLVRARAAPQDGRQRWLALTSKGQKAFKTLDVRATDSVVSLIQGLGSPERQELASAVMTVEALLDGAPTEAQAVRADAVELRSPDTGDLGWVVQRHGELYSREYGWSVDFERLVARIVGEFAAGPGGPTQQCWIATVGGRRAGCIFLMPGAQSDVSRLRLLLVEPWARGHSLGTRLVATCIDAARRAGCARLTLWTNDVLVAARRIYERAGFRLTHSERHHSFGKSLVGQTWELML